RDERTGRITLVDLFTDVTAAAFPYSIPSLCVYARLTDAAGTYEFAIDVVRRTDLGEVAQLNIGRLEALDPLEDGEVFVHHLEVLVPSAGSYDVRLWANQRFVQSVSFRVLGYNRTEEGT